MREEKWSALKPLPLLPSLREPHPRRVGLVSSGNPSASRMVTSPRGANQPGKRVPKAWSSEYLPGPFSMTVTAAVSVTSSYTPPTLAQIGVPQCPL